MIKNDDFIMFLLIIVLLIYYCIYVCFMKNFDDWEKDKNITDV